MSEASPTCHAGTASGHCRLCDGALLPRFEALVLGRHHVQYLECAACGSLQTEEPYWLAEAYDRNLSSLDTGAARRNLNNLPVCHFLARLLGVRSAVDFGGGDGLLCRLLRDHGLDCRVQDKYSKPVYAQGFSVETPGSPDMIMAFEVLEHLARPAEELRVLFEPGPAVLLLSTSLYEGQGPDWWFVAPESGQHVFFPSRRAAQRLADAHGYRLLVGGGYLLFVRPSVLSWWKRPLAALLLRRPVNRLLGALMTFLPTPGIWRDHLAAKAAVPSRTEPPQT
jgi:hypothetical protein